MIEYFNNKTRSSFIGYRIDTELDVIWLGITYYNTKPYDICCKKYNAVYKFGLISPVKLFL